MACTYSTEDCVTARPTPSFGVKNQQFIRITRKYWRPTTSLIPSKIKEQSSWTK